MKSLLKPLTPNPNISVILTSTYSQEAVAGAMMSPPQVRSFNRKPFSIGDLLNTLRTALPS
jgi:hypothetical protein